MILKKAEAFIAKQAIKAKLEAVYSKVFMN
jgi:hypothetical protein